MSGDTDASEIREIFDKYLAHCRSRSMPEYTDIAELFSRDPLTLTREDIGEMVQHYRAKRALFMAPASEKRAKPARAKPAKKTTESIVKDDVEF